MAEATTKDVDHAAKGTLLTPFLLGMAAPILIYRTLGWGFDNIPLGITFSAVVFGLFSGFACWLLPRRIAAVIAMLYAGIPIGMFVDAAVDFSYFHRDRNLIPFEILLVWVVAVIPVAVGSFIGRWLRFRADRSRGVAV